jgi:hypothetical protein
MKYKSRFYFQISRKWFAGDKPKINDISPTALKLFVWLHELEHRYTNPAKDSSDTWFYRSNKSLADDTGMSVSTVQRAKRELKKHGMYRQWQMHWENAGKRSYKHVTAYELE